MLRSLELPLQIGRYVLTEEIASGGMAVVYKGRLDGPVGFARTVAIKRLHHQFAKDEDFVARFAAEARLAARIHHANVVQTLDFVETHGELFLVLEYVEGCTLSMLLSRARERDEPMPVSVSVGIVLGALQGLSAAHELCADDGAPLAMVHRDFSPQNVLVGVDGVARVLDFGIAKVAGWNLTRQTGHLAGKLAYMSPEQSAAADVDQRSDVFSAGIMLWEALTGSRLFGGTGLTDVTVLRNVLDMPIAPPSKLNPDVSPALEAVVLAALQRDLGARLPSARQFAIALQGCTRVASSSEISDFLRQSEGMQRPSSAPHAVSAKLPDGSAPSLAPVRSLGLASAPVRGSLASDADTQLHERSLPLPALHGTLAPARRRALALAVAASVCIVSAFLSIQRWLPRHATLVVSHPTAARSSTSLEPPTLPAPRTEVPWLVSSARNTEPPEPVLPAPTRASSPAAATAALPKAPPASRPVTRAKKPAGARAGLDCTVPTYTDSEGISHFKDGCL